MKATSYMEGNRGVIVAPALAGLRSYLRDIRTSRGISQQQLADAIDFSLRSLIDWENGKTDDIKSSLLFRMVSYLRASLSDVEQLIVNDAPVEEGHRLAQSWLTAEQQQRIADITTNHPEEDVRAAIAELRAEFDEMKRRLNLD